MTQITEPPQKNSAAVSQPAVLIVEDEPLLRMLAIDIAEEAGLAAFEASTADEAIEILEQHSDIGVVFTDVNMPGSMSGTDLASLVRDRWPPIAVFITSGKAQVKASELPKGSVFIPKPYDINALVETLQRLAPPRPPQHHPRRAIAR
jgi:CheY-like chemotaxis protein